MKKIIFISLFLLTNVKSWSQTRDFTGIWIINLAKTEFGAVPQYLMPSKYFVQQSKEEISIIKTISDEQGNVHLDTLRLKLNGEKFQSFTPTQKKMISTIRWEGDRKNLSLAIDSYYPDGKQLSHIEETWNLSRDGKMIINRQVQQLLNDLKYKIKGVYEKQ